MKSTLTAFSLLCIGSLHSKDLVTLNSGETLRGDVLSISEEKTILLNHQGADTPFQIDALQTQRIDLDGKGKKITEKSSSIIALNNGDLIPGKVTNIDELNVEIVSQMMGDFTIARNQIDYISYGSSVFHPIYKFNNSKKVFSSSNRNWVVNNDAFEAHQLADMWQSFPLTKNFVIKCQLQWDRDPQINFHIAAKQTGAAATNQRYQLLLQNSSTTLTLFTDKVKAKAQRATTTLAKYEGKVDLELWISQTKGEVTLMLDNKKAHTFGFPITPQGNFIGIQNQSNQNKISIKNLEIATWDGIQTPHSLGLIGNSETDFIITKNDSRFRGKVLSSSDREAEKQYKITYPHSTAEAQLIDEKNIQLIKFLSNPSLPSKLKPSILEGGSKLKLSNIRIEDQKVLAEHEILGPISIAKKYLTQISLNH